MSYDIIESKLFSLITTASSLPDTSIVKENDNGTRPQTIYMTYDFIATPIGTPYLGDPNADGEREKIHNYSLEIELNFYNEGAKNQALLFWESLSDDVLILKQRELGIKIYTSPTVQDLTALQDTKYQERSLLQVRGLCELSSVDEISFIETLDYGLTLEGKVEQREV